MDRGIEKISYIQLKLFLLFAVILMSEDVDTFEDLGPNGELNIHDNNYDPKRECHLPEWSGVVRKYLFAT